MKSAALPLFPWDRIVFIYMCKCLSPEVGPRTLTPSPLLSSCYIASFHSQRLEQERKALSSRMALNTLLPRITTAPLLSHRSRGQNYLNPYLDNTGLSNNQLFPILFLPSVFQCLMWLFKVWKYLWHIKYRLLHFWSSVVTFRITSFRLRDYVGTIVKLCGLETIKTALPSEAL